MLEDAPQVLIAQEQGFGAVVRQSTWAYPAANIGHVMSLVLFVGAVAVMDVRLLGAFPRTPWPDVVAPFRRLAAAGLLLMLLSGCVLFAAEASHLAGNRVFQVKMLLLVAALANAVAAGWQLRSLPQAAEIPSVVRVSAALSLMLWLAIAGAGRTIAYF